MPVCPHIETSQLICCANQLTGIYMRATLAFNGLTNNAICGPIRVWLTNKSSKTQKLHKNT